MKRQLLAAVASVWMFGTSLAFADVLPPDGCSSTSPDVKLCDGKKSGDACVFANGTKGNCSALRCTTDGGATLYACVASGASTPSTGCSAAMGVSSAGLGMLLAGGAALTLLAARRRRKN